MKTSVTPLVLILLGAALAAGGCSKESSNPGAPGNSGGMVPLAVGNSWTTRNYEYDFSTRQLLLKDTSSETIARDSLIGGEKWYCFSASDMFANRSTGVWYYDSENGPQMQFKYPAHAGDAYVWYTGKSSSPDTVAVTVLSLNESITLPAGTFSCHVYRETMSGTPYVSTVYVAPGVGPVLKKAEGPDPRGGTITMYRSELIAYTLK